MKTMESSQNRLPLFPLPLVLLPFMPLPLHIFEERYRKMAAHCLEQNQPFGVVYAGSNQTRTIGCTARISRVTKRYDDGRLDIMCVGEQRFRAEQPLQLDPWLAAEVAYFGDEDTHRIAELAPAAREVVKKLELYAAVVGGTVDRAALDALEPQQLSFVTSASGMFSLAQRQNLLELTSTLDRLQAVKDMLMHAIARRRMTRAAQRVVGSDTDIEALLN